MPEKTPRPYGTLLLFVFWGLLLAVVFFWMLPDKTTVPPAWYSTEPSALRWNPVVISTGRWALSARPSRLMGGVLLLPPGETR